LTVSGCPERYWLEDQVSALARLIKIVRLDRRLHETAFYAGRLFRTFRLKLRKVMPDTYGHIWIHGDKYGHMASYAGHIAGREKKEGSGILKNRDVLV
jgi:hypothetical protein